MKIKIQPPPARVVTITRPNTDPVEVTLHPIPIGYMQHLETVYPQPVRFVNGEPQPDPSRRSSWSIDTNLMVIARSMGDQMDTQPPTTSGAAEWAAYAKAVRAEFDSAGFTDGEIADLVTALQSVLRGTAKLGNG